MIQSTSYLVCFGKREKKREKTNERKKRKKVREKKERRKKSVRKKKREKKNSDLFRLNLVVEFGLESVLCTVQ